MAKGTNKKQASDVTKKASPTKTFSRFTEDDIALFKVGKHYRLYDKLGSHVQEYEGVKGTYFAVWAPNAKEVSVTGGFNHWSATANKLLLRWDGSGIWEGFVPDVGHGELYKYHILGFDNRVYEKSDPFALSCEIPPQTASMVWHTYYEWQDADWMKARHERNALDKPISIYEMHIGSWARDIESPYELMNYRQVAAKLVPYLKEMGFTHVEFMPVMEHPYYPSWGYQITGYFAATSRYGSPQDLMFLVEELHKNGIGVILDWVPSHFPGDGHGLYHFDGTHLYEHADMRKGFQPDWQSYIFNYGRNEVKSFLISNALFWLDRYHADGFRVDAVASMLFLNFSRKNGEWEPNEYGGTENLEAVAFLKEFNEAVYMYYPDVQTIAEESTSFAGVSHPVWKGGLGFGMKWMMGWMNDTLDYFKTDPLFRKFDHNKITFSAMYAFSENFMLPLSHDEVVHGKASMIYKMPGDEWQKFANLRLLYVYMYTHPGTKLLFMGSEFAQTGEWNFTRSLDWHLLEFEPHTGIRNLVAAMNGVYTGQPALYENSFTPNGFEWVKVDDKDNSLLAYLRKGKSEAEQVLVVLNFTPNPHKEYKIGVDSKSKWKLILNSDDTHFHGSGYKTPGRFTAKKKKWHGKPYVMQVDIPPLAGLVFKRVE